MNENGRQPLPSGLFSGNNCQRQISPVTKQELNEARGRNWYNHLNGLQTSRPSWSRGTPNLSISFVETSPSTGHSRRRTISVCDVWVSFLSNPYCQHTATSIKYWWFLQNKRTQSRGRNCTSRYDSKYRENNLWNCCNLAFTEHLSQISFMKGFDACREEWKTFDRAHSCISSFNQTHRRQIHRANEKGKRTLPLLYSRVQPQSHNGLYVRHLQRVFRTIPIPSIELNFPPIPSRFSSMRRARVASREENGLLQTQWKLHGNYAVSMLVCTSERERQLASSLVTSKINLISFRGSAIIRTAVRN